MSGKVKTYKAGVKEYRETYWMPNYTPNETDILACFKITPQAGVPREEAAAAVAAESSTGTWTTTPATLNPSPALRSAYIMFRTTLGSTTPLSGLVLSCC